MTTRTKLVALFLLLTFHAAAVSDSQDPLPLDIRRIDATKKGPPSDGLFLWNGDGWKIRRSRPAAGIRPIVWPEGGGPTEQEFDAWLALPDEHEYAKDLIGYLEWAR